MVTTLAIAGSLAGWLIAVRVFTGGPRLGRAARHPGAARPPAAPPAVVALVAGRPEADLITVTWLDLAARGWFRLTPGLPDPRALAPAICALPAEAPADELTPYERRAIAHLSRRAGPLPEIPAAALADGFEGSADSFRRAFRGEVVADARRLGLTRPALSPARKALLCLFALVPGGVALPWVSKPSPPGGRLAPHPGRPEPVPAMAPAPPPSARIPKPSHSSPRPDRTPPGPATAGAGGWSPSATRPSGPGPG